MLTKMVDGKEITLSQEEEAEVRAEWAKNSTESTEARRVSDIKKEAQKRIIAHLPSGSPDNFIIKQMNLMMLNAELDDIVINGGTLTTEQAAMKASFIQLKDAIKGIRDMSNTAEASGYTLDKFKSDLDLVGL